MHRHLIWICFKDLTNWQTDKAWNQYLHKFSPYTDVIFQETEIICSNFNQSQNNVGIQQEQSSVVYSMIAVVGLRIRSRLMKNKFCWVWVKEFVS